MTGYHCGHFCLQGSEAGFELADLPHPVLQLRICRVLADTAAGEEVVGFAKLSLTAPAAAGHAMTAVRRAWRGRGIAGALKAAEISWALAHGYTELHTSNEERNTPIKRLNARLGYRPGIGRIHLAGPIMGGASR